MKAVIAEKPSVAREIATLLGAKEKKEGYLQGGGYMVTWALGHLIGLGMPEDYGISGFAREALPILPNPFLLTARKIKNGKSVGADPAAWKQLMVIDQVFKACDSIVVATDAGREGELIFRYIYEYLDCKKPFQRLWISSLTEKAIRSGFDNLKAGKEFDGLFLAARARSRADWVVGINASQALTLAAQRGVYSLGRVQTPTLAFVCKRYLENKDFIVHKYWQLELEHEREFVRFKCLSDTKWDEKTQAEAAQRSICRIGQATVAKVDTKKLSEQPPLLYDLTGLQKEANRKLGFSAEETLAIAQSLYEKKFITYPRTGSKYIPEDMWPEVSGLVAALDNSPGFKDAVAKVKYNRFNKRMVNDLKVTDHHGLLITDKVPSAVSAKENAIYEMIAYRFLEAISGPCSKEITDVKLQILHYEFSLKGCLVTEAGWRAISGNMSDESDDPLLELPQLKVGDELKIEGDKILEKKTKPPVLFTEASLLSAMENAGREMQGDEERKALQGIGIGTPATRAAIIETLLKREYIQRAKKSLLPTEKGLQVYQLTYEKRIADVGLSADWEMSFQKIENGEAEPAVFEKQMEDYARVITRELLSSDLNFEKYPDLTCPRCKSEQLLIREKIAKCPDDSCGWHHFRNICGVQLSISDLEHLITRGKTDLIKGMKSRSGKKFDAYLVMDDQGQTSLEFIKAKPKKR